MHEHDKLLDARRREIEADLGRAHQCPQHDHVDEGEAGIGEVDRGDADAPAPETVVPDLAPVVAPADLVLFDPDAPFVLDRFALLSKSKNTPFDGARMQGRVLGTWVAGTPVFGDHA